MSFEAQLQQETQSHASKKAPGAFRTISEVAVELSVPQHVLRFWETKFPQVRPLKRGGGRRYYRPEDVGILKTIHTLLYTEKYTIKGVQKLLKTRSKAPEMRVLSVSTEVPAHRASVSSAMSDKTKSALRVVLQELKDLRGLISI
jgi:DNA-binding transcriptional MerR regulator